MQSLHQQTSDGGRGPLTLST